MDPFKEGYTLTTAVLGTKDSVLLQQTQFKRFQSACHEEGT